MEETFKKVKRLKSGDLVMIVNSNHPDVKTVGHICRDGKQLIVVTGATCTECNRSDVKLVINILKGE
jgi:hypothetical protein